MGWTANVSLTITYEALSFPTPSAGGYGGNSSFAPLTAVSPNITCSSTIIPYEMNSTSFPANFSWYRNGTIQASENGICLNATACSSTISPTFSKGDYWTCSISAFGRSASSAPAIVQNSLPAISNEVIGSANGTHSFTATARATDPDGAPDIVSCYVSNPSCRPTYLYETGNLNEKECRSDCSSSLPAPLQVAMTFSDADGANATTGSASINVPNAPPETTEVSVSLSSANATRNYASISCIAQGSDPDGDRLSLEYSFSSQSETLLPLSSDRHFECAGSPGCYRGRRIRCSARATDSFLAASAETLSAQYVEIENAPPEIPQVARDPRGGTLSFESVPDEDGDALGYFVLGGQTNPPVTTIYSGNATIFQWSPAGSGTFYWLAFSSDGFSNSSPSATMNFTVAPHPPPVATTTMPLSSGEGAPPSGGVSPVPQEPLTPSLSAPDDGGASRDGRLELVVDNPTNSTLRLEYNSSNPIVSLDCGNVAIQPRSNGTRLTCIAHGTASNFSASFFLVSPDGRVEKSVFLSGLSLRESSSGSSPLAPDADIKARARGWIDELFLVWSDCALPEAKAKMDALQLRLDSYRRAPSNSTQAALSSALLLSQAANVSCPQKTPAQAGNGTGERRLPTPAFTAPADGGAQGLFARILALLSRVLMWFKSLF